MTRTTPLRLMILQLRQSRLTDASTFMESSTSWFDCQNFANTVARSYFARNVIRARERSYGETSTVTLSPGRMRM